MALALGSFGLAAYRRRRGAGPAVSGGRGASRAVKCGPSCLSWVARRDSTGQPAAGRVIGGGVCPPLHLLPRATAGDG